MKINENDPNLLADYRRAVSVMNDGVVKLEKNKSLSLVKWRIIRRRKKSKNKKKNRKKLLNSYRLKKCQSSQKNR